MRAAGRLPFVLICLSLNAAAPVAAQSLDIAVPYGNKDGCKFAKSGQMDSDDTLLLKADGFESYGTACEFVQVLPAKDGSKVVVGLCAFEGEDGFGTQNFVIRKSQKDPAAITIYSNNGDVFGEVSPCP